MERAPFLPLPGRGPFYLSSPDVTLIASGVEHNWTTPLSGNLSGEVREHLAQAPSDAIAVGALPFHPDAPCCLFQPREVTRIPTTPVAPRRIRTTAAGGNPPPISWRAEDGGGRSGYEACVGRALRLMQSGEARLPEQLQKVVLARSVLLRTARPVDVAMLVARLRHDPRAAVFATPLPPQAPGGERTLIGATPELLLQKTGQHIVTEPLAGSRRRLPDATADADTARSLKESEKDRLEHTLVVEYTADILAPYCSRLDIPAAPSLVATDTMWHLGTRIEAVLRDPWTTSLEILSKLHPTPAVCGFPARRAAEVISDLEPFDRGFYAGAVGWCDARGDGSWYLAIRCAEVTPDAVRLYAGAGIVDGSDPVSEFAETSAKLRAMLEALGINESRASIDEGDHLFLDEGR